MTYEPTGMTETYEPTGMRETKAWGIVFTASPTHPPFHRKETLCVKYVDKYACPWQDVPDIIWVADQIGHANGKGGVSLQTFHAFDDDDGIRRWVRANGGCCRHCENRNRNSDLVEKAVMVFDADDGRELWRSPASYLNGTFGKISTFTAAAIEAAASSTGPSVSCSCARENDDVDGDGRRSESAMRRYERRIASLESDVRRLAADVNELLVEKVEKERRHKRKREEQQSEQFDTACSVALSMEDDCQPQEEWRRAQDTIG